MSDKTYDTFEVIIEEFVDRGVDKDVLLETICKIYNKKEMEKTLEHLDEMRCSW